MRTRLATPGIAASVVGGVLALMLWMLGTAMPVAADGGPHVGLANSGIGSLTADGCAGCHRAHTAQGRMLLVADTDTELCLVCHGLTGQGATTDVEGGVQYSSTADYGRAAPVAGALRSGGFVEARIDSAHSSRISYPAYMPTLVTTFSSKVGVLAAGQPTTSAHLDVGNAGLVATKGVAWGNGARSATPDAGPVVELGCATCHNPHGNGRYRILNEIPLPTGAGFVAAPDPAPVEDLALPSGSGASGVRNYTVQVGRTLADVIAAGDGPAAGDYWRRYIPWDLVPAWDAQNGEPGPVPPGGQAGDIPMYVPGDPGNLTAFRGQMSSWCATCHSRYFVNNSGAVTDSLDAIYRYRHTTTSVECTQCHVAHGSNAAMDGPSSGPMAYPNGTDPASTGTGQSTVYYNSRLLKIDNRGTCQACHDPTGTIPYDNSVISH